jgi:predicted type IV restriction endonuclease
VIGHFNIGKDGRGDFTLKPDATHFVVLEAKMFSKLSAGTTRASYYNQAARYVGCIVKQWGRP